MMHYLVLVHYIKSQWNFFYDKIVEKSKGGEYVCKVLYMD